MQALDATADGHSTPQPSPPRERDGRSLDAVLVAAAAIALSSFAWFWPSTTVDEISLLIYGDLVGGGRIPNEEFFTPYGPGSYWPLAALNWAFGGPSVAIERVVGLGYHVLVALAVWAVCRRFGRGAAMAAGVMSAVLTAGLLLVAYPWLAALAAAVWACSIALEKRWLVAGLLGALSCTVRPEFLFVVAPVVGVTVTDRVAARRLAAGFALGGIGLWWHLAVAGESLLRNVFVDRLNGENRLPLPPEDPALVGALAALVLASAFLVVRAARSRARPDLAIALLALLLIPQAFQRADRDHFLFVACVVIPVALAAAVPQRFRDASRGLPAVHVALVLVTALGAGFLLVSPRGDVAQVADRSLITKSPAASSWMLDVVAEVRRQAPPGRTMFVGATDMSEAALSSNYIYYLMPERIPDAYFLEMAPGISEKEGSGLVEDVEAADVLVLTEFRAEQRRHLVPFASPGSGRVNRYVREHFCPVSERFEVRILRRCA